MVEPLRHRQTKEAETDMVDLKPPRHTPTLHFPAIHFGRAPRPSDRFVFGPFLTPLRTWPILPPGLRGLNRPATFYFI